MPDLGETDKVTLRLDFDRRLLLQFRGSAITSVAALLAYGELDDAVGLTNTVPKDSRTHAPVRTVATGWRAFCANQVFGRLAGYEDVNDVERLCCDPAMRWVVGDGASPAVPPRPARWAGLRRTGSVGRRTLPRSPNCPAKGSTRFGSGDRRRSSCSHGFEREPDASRKVVPTMAILAAPVTTRSLCSTNSAIWSSALCGRATSTTPPAGGTCWSQWSPAIGARAIKWTRPSCRARCQRDLPSTPCSCLQPWKLHADAGDAPRGGAVVADQPAAEMIKIGAKVVSHSRYVTFQLAEVAVPRRMFQKILSLIARLRMPPAPA
jgi:hypothetical protein